MAQMRKRIDLTGQKFGRLTVLQYVGNNKWECQCECIDKNLVYTTSQKLKSGHTKSCGCLRREKAKLMSDFTRGKPQHEDITGQKFGRLTVIEYVYTKNKRAYWKCKCDCGNFVTVATKSLKNGATQSCGCLRKEFLVHNTRENRNVKDYPQWFIDELANEEDKQKALNKVLTSLDIVEFICPIHGIYKQKVGDHISKGQRKCGCFQCGLETKHTTSAPEIEIDTYIRDFGFVTTKDRTILDGKEIDIFIPSLNLGIEYNGSYYHSTLGADYTKSMYYHRDKFLLAKEKGIHLISVFDVDWTNNKEKIKNYFSSLLLPQKKLMARKCEIRKVENSLACDFVDKYHLQGSNKAMMKINYGLYYNNELFAIMSFGKLRLSKTGSGQYELHRYAVKDGYTIVGGANKLLKYFEREYKPKYILSYSDNDYFLGGIYERLGFENKGQCRPRYYWYLNGEELKRERCMLKNLKRDYPELLQEAYDVEASNKEDYVMTHLGAYKVYRSGNTKWEKNYN